ncbi:reverse transcriptase domain-containing protein [Tanacetum coccineum]
MAIGTGHRSNNYSESKRNDHLDNNHRQEQRNKGIPNKSHPNFREEHKSFSSIFVSNIPWNASVQDLWDICNKWGVVELSTVNIKRKCCFQSFSSYARSVLCNKSVDRSGKYGTCNAGAESVGVSDLVNKVYKGSVYVGDVGLVGNFDSMDVQVKKRQDFKGANQWALEVYKKLGGRWGSSVFTDMVSDGPMSHGKNFLHAMRLGVVKVAFGWNKFEKPGWREDVYTAAGDIILVGEAFCMTRSSTNELFTPYKEPEREFRSSRRHFKSLSLDELRSPDFNLFSDQEYSEEEEAEAMAETMEQYMSKTRTDYGSGVARPKIEEKDSFELKDQFLKELRENTFSGSDNEDANEHIENVLEIVNLFHVPNITEVILFYNGLDVPTRQILDSRDVVPTKTAADAKKAIQEMAEYSQKWHNRTSRGRSTETSNGLAAIQAQLNNLGREIRKVNEKVYAAQVGCEQCKGPHYTKDCPLKEE